MTRHAAVSVAVALVVGSAIQVREDPHVKGRSGRMQGRTCNEPTGACTMDGGSVAAWPQGGLTVWDELAQGAGRFALIVGRDVEETASKLAEVRAVPVCHVGALLAASFERAPRPREVEKALEGQSVLVDTQVLFDPLLQLNPLALLRQLARSGGPLMAQWPGDVGGAVASCGQEGRPGRFRQILDDCLVLRPISTLFDDETPFTIERLN